MMLALGVGALAGFVASTPLGPINLLAAGYFLRDQRKAIVPFLSGVIGVDAAFASISVIGFTALLNDLLDQTLIVLFGNAFIIGLGIFGLRSAWKGQVGRLFPNVNGKGTRLSNSASFFIKGVVICAANPGFLIYWIYVSNLLNDRGYDLIGWGLLVFVIGVIAGNVLWFVFFMVILRKSSKRLGHKPIAYINIGISISLILLGLLHLLKEFV